MNTPTARQVEVDSKTPVRLRRARVDSIDLFEVKENELDILERGSQADLYLNFAVFLLSLAFSAIIAINTSQFNSDTVRQLVLIVMVVGFIVGVICLILWFRDRNTVRAVIGRIRERINTNDSPEFAQEKLPDRSRDSSAIGQADGPQIGVKD